MELSWNSSLPLTLPSVRPRRERLRTLLVRERVGGIIRDLPARLGKELLVRRHALTLERKLAGPIVLPPAPPDLMMRSMVQGDLERFRQPAIRLSERRIQDFTARLASGRTAVIALREDAVCGYGWVSRRAEIEVSCGVEISFHADEGYIYDGFIFPAHRRTGLYPQLLLWRLRYLEERGCQAVYSIVLSNNTAALKAHRDAGFAPCAELNYVKFCGLRWRSMLPSQSGVRGS